MARLVGIDLPRNKRIDVALTYIYGIGPKLASDILTAIGLDFSVRVKDLAEDDIVKLRNEIANFVVEGDLRRRNSQDIRRLHDIGCYRGMRHKRKLPCRGQRTHTNARTRRGKAIAVAGKKKVTK